MAAMDTSDFHIFEENVSEIRALPGNSHCVDCGVKDPAWGSLGFGVAVCLDCAGFHRSLGVHITAVRSMTMDKWGPEHIAQMMAGGNTAFVSYVREVDSTLLDEKFLKYNLHKIIYYREIIFARVENREPVDFDPSMYSPTSSPTAAPRQGGTSTPPEWIPDRSSNSCMICSKKFSVVFRRHHCRRCGMCVCRECAPRNNSRPILEWGLKDPVRHCKICYKSPAVQWAEYKE